MTKHRSNKNSSHNIHKHQIRHSPCDNERRTKSPGNGCYRNNATDSSDMEEDSEASDVSDSLVNDGKTTTSSVYDDDKCVESTRLLGTNSDEILNEGVRTKTETRVCYSALKDEISLDDSLSRSHKSSSRTSLSNVSIDEEPEPEVKGFSLRKLSRDQLIILVATCTTSLVSFLSLSIIAPFFPLEADKKNVNSTISGWIFGVYALVQFIASPFFGHLMPKVGSRFMYISGLFICGGCSLLFGVLDRVDTSEDITLFVSLCLLTRILLALGSTGLNNAGFVFIIKYFPDHIATVFGIAEIFTGVGMVTGPALGGFLYTTGGYTLPFAFVSGCCFVALPFIWFFIPQQDDSETTDECDISLKEVLLHPRSMVNCLVVVVSTTVWSVLDPTLEPHLRVRNFSRRLPLSHRHVI